jgi:cystathionine gamma-lyase
MEVWLAHRSLATLGARLDHQCHNAHAIAEYLVARTEVLSAHCPGLTTNPTHPIVKRQMKLFGPVVSFILPDQDHSERFLQYGYAPFC